MLDFSLWFSVHLQFEHVTFKSEKFLTIPLWITFSLFSLLSSSGILLNACYNFSLYTCFDIFSNVLLLHLSSYFLNYLFIFIFFYPFNFVIKIVYISRSLAFLTSVAIFSYFQNVWLVILQYIFNFHIAYFSLKFKISLKIHLIMLNMSVLYSFKILFLGCVCWELFLFLWLYIFSHCYLCWLEIDPSFVGPDICTIFKAFYKKKLQSY